MINTKATLKKLHAKFPLLNLDELFNILDCIVEESLFTTTPNWGGTQIWCNDNKNSLSLPTEGKITATDPIKASTITYSAGQ